MTKFLKWTGKTLLYAALLVFALIQILSAIDRSSPPYERLLRFAVGAGIFIWIGMEFWRHLVRRKDSRGS